MDQQRLASALVRASAVANLGFPGRTFEGREANEIKVLLAVGVWGEQSVGEVTDRLALHYSTVSHAVSRLLGDGLLRGRADRSDHRRKLLSLTAKGSKLAERFLDQVPDEAHQRLK